MIKFVVSLHQPGTYIDGQAVIYKLHETGSGNSDFVSNGVVKFEENKAGTFEFDILPSHTYYSILRRYIQYISVKKIDEEEQLGGVIFYGRILSMSLSFNGTKHVVCEGLLANLLDCPVYDPQNLAGAPAAEKVFTMTGSPDYMFMNAISAYRNLIRQDIAMDYLSLQVPMEVSEYEDIDVSSGTSVGDFLMNNFVDTYGGFMYLDYVEANNGDISGLIRWVKDPSMEGYEEETLNQTITFGINMLDLSAENGSDEIMTGIIPMWTDENGETQWTTTTATDVDDSQGTVYKPVVVGSTGGLGAIGLQVVNLPGVKTQAFASAYASGYVSRYCQYDLSTVDFDSVTVKAMDLNYIEGSDKASISLYSPVTISCAPLSFAKVLICTQMEVNLDNPEISSYTFSVFRPKASSNDKVLTRQLVKYASPVGTGTNKYASADNTSY